MIDSISAACRLPAACLKAVLLMEVPEIDWFDVLADSTVALNWKRYALFHSYTPKRHTRNPLYKFDSSTGYGQIFARVAIEAIHFAESRNHPGFRLIGERFSPENPDDLMKVWKRLHKDKVFNLQCTALNLVHAAFQMTGRTDFESFTPEELKLIFTRYNANVKYITAYGEKAYSYYLDFLSQAQ